jgi:hypothetical protein
MQRHGWSFYISSSWIGQDAIRFNPLQFGRHRAVIPANEKTSLPPFTLRENNRCFFL